MICFEKYGPVPSPASARAARRPFENETLGPVRARLSGPPARTRTQSANEVELEVLLESGRESVSS
jgi:hypothetical protein